LHESREGTIGFGLQKPLGVEYVSRPRRLETLNERIQRIGPRDVNTGPNSYVTS
jgi:hypothetical protein